MCSPSNAWRLHCLCNGSATSQDHSQIQADTPSWQVDPHLARTVVVSTKLDTRLPQFGCGEDVEMFLRPPGRLLEPGMLSACPFFTWVLALLP